MLHGARRCSVCHLQWRIRMELFLPMTCLHMNVCLISQQQEKRLSIATHLKLCNSFFILFVCEIWKFLRCQNILEFNEHFPDPLNFSENTVQWSAIDFVDIDNWLTENVSEHFVLAPRSVECCDIVAEPEGVDVTLDYCFKQAIVADLLGSVTRLYYQFQTNVSFFSFLQNVFASTRPSLVHSGTNCFPVHLASKVQPPAIVTTSLSWNDGSWGQNQLRMIK